MNLHTIKRGNSYFIYIPDSYDIVKVNRLSYIVIQQLISGQSKRDICRNYNINISEIDEMESYFRRLSTKKPIYSQTEQIKHEDNVIDRITLHVSNDCNLRCKYCYASGGNYLSEKKMMSTDIADAFVEFCARMFSEVRNIVFFGGEPFLNPSVILHICQLFESKYKNREIRFLPRFGAITNGTIISPLIMEIIRNHFSFLTVSIDGPKIINDTNRIDIKGNGSFDRISNFINNVQNIPHLDLKYESTFTKEHLQMGYTRKDIQQFMNKTFHIHGIVLYEYHMEKDFRMDNEQYYNIDDIVHHKYPEGFWSIIQALTTKRPKTMCQVYRRNFSVSVDGYIFPCHMNTGTKNCCLGNIKSQNAYTSPQKFLSNHPGISEGLKNNKFCNSCWAKNLCGGCTRLWFYNEANANYSLLPNRTICKKNNRHIENILVSIYNLKANPLKWKSFLSEHFTQTL